MSSLNINYRLRLVPAHCVLVTRTLSPNSKIMVMKNQPVNPTDVLGISKETLGFSSIDLSKRLGISPRDGLKYLQKKIGSNIGRGELVALKTGLIGKKSIHSPIEGQIKSYDEKTGRLTIQLIPKEITVFSGVYGIVEEIEKTTGTIVIKTMATEILGVFGSGKRRSGLLKIINNFQSLTQSSQVTSDLRNHIVVSGSLIYGVALKKMIAYGVSGIITGGLNQSDFRGMGGELQKKVNFNVEPDIGLSIIATEGFGSVPIGEDLREILKKHEGKFCFIHGNDKRLVLPEYTEDVILTVSKIQLPKSRNSDNTEIREIKLLQKGDRVRIVIPPFMGRQGVVTNIDKTPTLLESGLKVFCVIVNLGTQKIKVPYTNIERI